MAKDLDLPIYNPVSDGKKPSRWRRLRIRLMVEDRRLHFIPLVVILSFIILWIFGSKFHHKGDISIEEDDYYSREQNQNIEINKSENMTNVRVDLAILSTAPINVSDSQLLFPDIADPSPVVVTGVTDLNPGLSDSLSFVSRRTLLIQEGNVSIEDEDFNDPVEIKKPESIKETRVCVDLVTTQINASDPEKTFPEIEPMTGNITINDEKIEELNEIKKHSDFGILSGNSSASQPLFQENSEISSLQFAGFSIKP